MSSPGELITNRPYIQKVKIQIISSEHSQIEVQLMIITLRNGMARVSYQNWHLIALENGKGFTKLLHRVVFAFAMQ